MAADLEFGQMTAAPSQRQEPEPERVPLSIFVANLLRIANDRERLPGRAAYVSPTGREFIVCGDDGGAENYRQVAELSQEVANITLKNGGPYVSGRYVPFDEAPEDWAVAFRRG